MMVGKLFRRRDPRPSDALLDPGCGTGAFVEGVARYCDRKGIALPRIVGIESDPRHIPIARERFADRPEVDIRQEDFLAASGGTYDFIIGNPPYVPITQLSDGEKAAYRSRFRTAVRRFDLYILFLEQAMAQLKPNGRLVFITPEKYLYVGTAEPLRRMMAARTIEELHFVDESAFGDLVTYPMITTLVNSGKDGATRVLARDGGKRQVGLPKSGISWQPAIRGQRESRDRPSLGGMCDRVSCGVATGADAVFVLESSDVPSELKRFAYPALSGRDIDTANGDYRLHSSMLIPYDASGALLREDRLGPLGDHLKERANRERLMRRTCARRKPWYAFHENPPMRDLLRPKIMCKDIAPRAFFIADMEGVVVPRHSVYYIVPKDPSIIPRLSAYLNSAEAQEWLECNCQRAANGFIRLQSQVLKGLPVPESSLDGDPGACAGDDCVAEAGGRACAASRTEAA